MKISTRLRVLTRKLVNYHLGRRTSCCQPGLFEDSADMPPINRTIDHLKSSWVSYRPLDVLITFLQFEGCAGLNWVMLPSAKISNNLMIEAKITSMLTLMFGSITATRVRVILLDFKRFSRFQGKNKGLEERVAEKKLLFDTGNRTRKPALYHLALALGCNDKFWVRVLWSLRLGEIH